MLTVHPGFEGWRESTRSWGRVLFWIPPVITHLNTINKPLPGCSSETDSIRKHSPEVRVRDRLPFGQVMPWALTPSPDQKNTGWWLRLFIKLLSATPGAAAGAECWCWLEMAHFVIGQVGWCWCYEMFLLESRWLTAKWSTLIVMLRNRLLIDHILVKQGNKLVKLVNSLFKLLISNPVER